MAGPETGDDALVEAFRHGDAAAMEALYARYAAGVFSWLAAFLHDRDGAEDLSQEIWIRAIRGIDRYGGGNFKAWLWRIARNAAIDESRRRAEPTVLDAPAGDGDGACAVVDTIPDEDAISAIEALEAGEARRAVRTAVDALPPLQREVVLLRMDSEMKFKDIADMLGIPLGTALGRMNLAMRRLKAALVGKGVVDD